MLSTSGPRYTVETLDFSTRVTISAASKPGCASLFTGAWLCGWGIGEILLLVVVVSSAIQSLTGGTSTLGQSWLNVLLWLLVWTAVGGLTLVNFLWQITGREVVEISHDAFKISRKVLKMGPVQIYNPTNIDNLRVDDSQPVVQPRFIHFGGAASASGGRLVFNYGGSPVRFGGSLDSSEAALLLAEIQARFSQYRTR